MRLAKEVLLLILDKSYEEQNKDWFTTVPEAMHHVTYEKCKETYIWIKNDKFSNTDRPVQAQTRF